MIRWPWQQWEKPPPPPSDDEIAAAKAARIEAARRKFSTQDALRARRAIVVHNHLATDIRRALERRG